MLRHRLTPTTAARRRGHGGVGIAEGAYDWRSTGGEAPSVRPADQRVPGPAMEARRHVDQAPRGAGAGLRPARSAKADFPTCCWPHKPRSSPRERHPGRHDALQFFVPAATRVSCRWSAWRATCACSPSRRHRGGAAHVVAGPLLRRSCRDARRLEQGLDSCRTAGLQPAHDS